VLRVRLFCLQCLGPIITGFINGNTKKKALDPKAFQRDTIWIYSTAGERSSVKPYR